MRQFAICLSATSALLALAAGAAPAQAGQALTVQADQSQMIILPSMPGSVVIGNPSIADATVEGSKMFIHGRGFGTTNFIIMDLNGEQIASFDVSVGREVSNAVTVFRGNSRYSYNCAPTCEAELQIGDNLEFNTVIGTQMMTKNQIATGQITAKSEAPPAPQ
jgi:hypothetical protein